MRYRLAPLSVRVSKGEGRKSLASANAQVLYPGMNSDSRIADVLVPVAVDIAYSYRVPAGMALAVGDFVTVPLGVREATGVVWALRGGSGDNLKTIRARNDFPPLPETSRAFIDWVANWTLSPRGMVLRMAVRVLDHGGPERVRLGVRQIGPPPKRMTAARAKLLAALPESGLIAKADLIKDAGCSAAVIDGLVDEGTLEMLAMPDEIAAPKCDFSPPQLEASQAAAADVLTKQVAAQAFNVTLLEGITGSGKTEVYFEAVAKALELGGQVLILMPEIALTSQFLTRFAARFGALPVEWHSGVSPRKRAKAWSDVASGAARVVAGARSALFLPFVGLSLIVVDEEHEAAYKQEDGVSYHARDMAVVRGRIETCAVVLASATPSIETQVNAAQGRYTYVRLENRFGGRVLPDLKAIDLRKDAPPNGQWIAPSLAEDVRATMARGEQALLFLNRRGYAPLTLCKTCGHKFQCPNCSAWLVEHRFRRALVCHHCGHVERRPDACPECAAVDSLTACGPGVERLAEEAGKLFPDARMLVFSSDMAGGMERLRSDMAKIANGEVDLVIGTQLVAKGHNFPLLTLVGVIDADVGLANGDPRAAERTFQLLAQVTGRAGRGEKLGRGMLQTFQPEHPVVQALLRDDAAGFYAAEIESRQRGGLPPFGRLAALIVSCEDRALAEGHAKALARAVHDMPKNEGWSFEHDSPVEVQIFGPAEAVVALVRGRYRFRLLVKATRKTDLQGFLRALIAAAPKVRGNLRVAIDVDPQSFM